jgi:flagellar motor switch protein FliM
MQPILDTLASQTLLTDSRGHDPVVWQHQLQDALHQVPVEISVRFGSVALTSSEIVGLEVGDVVPLNHPVDEPLTVIVDGVDCYRAVSGRRGKRLACLVLGSTQE